MTRGRYDVPEDLNHRLFRAHPNDVIESDIWTAPIVLCAPY